MSVHGEYNRALEAMLTSLRQKGPAGHKEWVNALENSRVTSHSDLSAAAQACLLALAAIDTERDLSSVASGIQPENDPLRAPFQHLKAHCEALLGPSDRRCESSS